MPPLPPGASSEQEVVAQRIEEKAGCFRTNAGPKYSSLPGKEREKFLKELERFINSLTWTSLTPGGIAYSLGLNTSNCIGYHEYEGRELILDFIETKDGKRLGEWASSLWRSDLVRAFQSEGEDWIRLAVFFEDAVEKITKKFEELYQKYLGSLDPEKRALSQDVYHLLLALDETLKKRNRFLSLLQDTIFFLRSTKGIFKSKRVQEFRVHLGEELKEAGFPDHFGRY